MPKVDRRILKSQAAIKKAVVELMSEKSFDDITIKDICDRADLSRKTFYLRYIDKYDLLDKLIEEHLNELRELCEIELEMELDYIEGYQIWFEFFEKNYLFFSTMIVSKGSPTFRNRFLEFIIEEVKGEVNTAEGINIGLNEEVFVQFFSSAFVGLVEWWFKNRMPVPPRVMAEQVGLLFERNL
ncbi:TetR/AcrR family transcriptional regulator [Bacillus inaquosorum]|uniref:TetR/AcrR family transcriptional regulator n=1 Tax=Bacillus inaquosorum TaxID=483913 RepID=UPI00227FDF38|nr:TetR/AcrR family transcriptional regulator C-terminal domain-containing protein [Bacillus inaquosorum]MCY7939610.1 TetR/AcrR family transcriptional regulator [Bacillus inaquosorum]